MTGSNTPTSASGSLGTTPAKMGAARLAVAGTDTALAELEVALERADRVTLHGDDAHQWSASDVWAHLGRWLDVGAQMVERYLAGERDIHDWDGGADEFNLGWIELDHSLSVAEARSRTLDAWARLRGQLLAVDEGAWNGYLAWHAASGQEHLLEHLRYIVDASGATPPAEAVGRLERDRGAWAEFVAALDTRPGVPLHDPESPTWTSREVFGHFARWTEHEVATFEAERDGRPAPSIDEPDDVVNERWAAEDRSMDLEAVRARALRAFAERAHLIVSTPAERWSDGMRASVAAEGYDHIAEHHRYLVE